jgi:hypothetical protein
MFDATVSMKWSMMLEFMKIWSIICDYSATFIVIDKRKKNYTMFMTSGACAAARMSYGRIYPSLISVFTNYHVLYCGVILLSHVHISAPLQQSPESHLTSPNASQL